MDLESSRCLDICITADICNAIFPEHRDKRRWDNIICGAIRFKETILNILDDFSVPPKITWFVRADPWMEKRFGSYTFLFERHGVHFARLAASGDEIGWHPHLDIRNMKTEIKQLPAIAGLVRRFFPVTSVRIGEAFHSSELIRHVNKLGFTADSTALPGRYNIESRTPFDWRNTPEKPYKPDNYDYRKENKNSTAGILEIPFTMLPIRLPYDKPGASSRYMNLSYRRNLFEEGIMSKREWVSPIVAIAHPAELDPPRGYSEKHPILSFNEDEPNHNLKFLLYRLRMLGFKVRYRCIREIPSLFEKDTSVKAYMHEKMSDTITRRIV